MLLSGVAMISDNTAAAASSRSAGSLSCASSGVSATAVAEYASVSREARPAVHHRRDSVCSRGSVSGARRFEQCGERGLGGRIRARQCRMVLFGLWCYAALVRPGHVSACAFPWSGRFSNSRKGLGTALYAVPRGWVLSLRRDGVRAARTVTVRFSRAARVMRRIVGCRGSSPLFT